MADPWLDVLVIGAGVSGLTTAICLAEAGLSVRVRTDLPPSQTTSAAAGAVWGPHLVETSARAAGWGLRTLAELRQLAGTVPPAAQAPPATGVRIASGVQAATTPDAQPRWTDALGEFEQCDAADLPVGYQVGWRMSAPVVDMPTYLDYLLGRFAAAGGQVETGVMVGSLDDAAREARAVVNCTGAYASALVPDPQVTPVRGQVVVVRNPGLTDFFVDIGESGPDLLYFLPHAAVAVLGGTAERGSFELRPDPRTAQRILDACAVIEPRLRAAEVLSHRVGFRPVRPNVRTEVRRRPDGRLLCHNYGHGGAGVTLSWGCARDLAGEIIGELR